MNYSDDSCLTFLNDPGATISLQECFLLADARADITVAAKKLSDEEKMTQHPEFRDVIMTIDYEKMRKKISQSFVEALIRNGKVKDVLPPENDLSVLSRDF